MSGNAIVTRMSSRGQVVIPESVRRELGLSEGSTFVVFGRKESDAILLKKLEFPDPVKEFEALSALGSAHAKARGFDVSPEKIVEVQHRRRKLRARGL